MKSFEIFLLFTNISVLIEKNMNKASYRQSAQTKGTQKDTVGDPADYYGIYPDNSVFNNVFLVINYDSE